MHARDDLPAAHSMDTSWFAVDAAGRVAIFDSGEDGAVPLAALSLGGASEPDPEATEICELFAPGDDAYDTAYEGGPFFHFCNGDYGDPGNYVRTDHVPAQPANVSTLPERLREKMLRLPVDFTSTATLHLADFMADADAATWGDTTLRGQPLAQPLAQSTRAQSGVGWVAVIVVILAVALLVAISST
jgi:hypothetical protein